MDYLYAAMWLIMGLILIFRFGRENRVFYLAGGLFLFLGACWAARPLYQIDLFSGKAGWALRGVIAVMLVIFCYVYYKENRKSHAKEAEGEESSLEKKDGLPGLAGMDADAVRAAFFGIPEEDLVKASMVIAPEERDALECAYPGTDFHKGRKEMGSIRLEAAEEALVRLQQALLSPPEKE